MKKMFVFFSMFLVVSVPAVAYKHTAHNFNQNDLRAVFTIEYASGCNIVAPPMNLAAGAGSSVEVDCNVATVKAQIGEGDNAQTVTWQAEEENGFAGDGTWQLNEKDGEFVIEKIK